MKKIIWVPVIVYCNQYKKLIINFPNPILKIDDRTSLHFLNHNYSIYSSNPNEIPIYFFDRDEAESVVIMLKLTKSYEYDDYRVHKMELEEGLEDDWRNWKMCNETNQRG